MTTLHRLGGFVNKRGYATIPPHILAQQGQSMTAISQKRVKRKLLYGKTRPAVYFNFDCKVELSDGSTYTRQSPYPRLEWRYLRDQRIHPIWNPTIKGLAAQPSDSAGRVSRFNQRYGKLNGARPGEETVAGETKAEVVTEAETTAEAATESEPAQEQAVEEEDEDEGQANAFDDLTDLLDEFEYKPAKNAKVQTKRGRRY
ncbi:hypothetical protein V1512DRAFT_258489 [Lipomyces arxii]|uniref:mitochondrial 54S ribosomal protein bL31m n=1 Tax=Lipomyces arxii TaxID=56418 RepID=UPI0034CE140E